MRDIKIKEIQQLETGLFASIIEDETHRLLTIVNEKTKQGLIQGRMKLTDPLSLESAYMPSMLVGLEWNKNPQNITIMGLGIGALPRYLRAHYPNTHIRIVEKYMEIITLAETHFFEAQAAKEYQYVIDDYMAYLLRSRHVAFQDLLIIDVFTNKSTIEDMNHSGFYSMCERQTREKGVLTINLIGDAESITSCFVVASKVFEYVYQIEVKHSGNTVLVASNTPAPEETNLCLITNEPNAQDNALKIIQRTARRRPDLF